MRETRFGSRKWPGALVRGAVITALVPIVLAMLVACAGAPADAQPAVSAPAIPASPATPLADVQRLIGPATCSRDADCRSAPLGQRACGGPERYVAWSVRVTDEAALGAALARESARQAVLAAKQGRMSTCVITPDPGASCVAAEAAASGVAATRRCVLNDTARANAAR